jgi:hypothetical protein
VYYLVHGVIGRMCLGSCSSCAATVPGEGGEISRKHCTVVYACRMSCKSCEKCKSYKAHTLSYLQYLGRCVLINKYLVDQPVLGARCLVLINKRKIGGLGQSSGTEADPPQRITSAAFRLTFTRLLWFICLEYGRKPYSSSCFSSSRSLL